jgi:S-layer homology domain
MLRRRLLMSGCVIAVITVAMLIALVSLALADPVSFPDVPASHPYHTAILDLASRGIIGGYANGNFGPTDDVARQQFAKMAVLTGGYPVSEANVCTFVDVPKAGPTTLYPDNYIAVCAAAGITTGTTPTTFDPYGNITRYQVLSMVVRMADNLHPGLLAAPPSGYAGSSGWGSNPTHGANALRAEYNGLLAGLQLATLNPNGNMSRGEVAQVLHNLLVKMTPTTTTTGASTTTTGASTTTTGASTTTTSSTTTTTAPALGYESQGGLVLAAGSGPAVASWGTNHLDVFARGSDNQLWWKTWDGSSWGPWKLVAGLTIASDPAAVSWGPNNIEVFAEGADGACWQIEYNGSTWSAWGSLGGALTSAPTVSSRGPGKLDVFVRGPGNFLYVISLDTSVNPYWGSWIPLSTVPVASAPAAVSWNGTDVDLFVTGTDNALWHTFWNGSVWSTPESLGGLCASGPAAASWAYYRLDVFVRSLDNKLYTKHYTSLGWSDWEVLPGTVLFQGDPDAVSWGPGRIDLFANGQNSTLYHKSWVGSLWVP